MADTSCCSNNRLLLIKPQFYRRKQCNLTLFHTFKDGDITFRLVSENVFFDIKLEDLPAAMYRTSYRYCESGATLALLEPLLKGMDDRIHDDPVFDKLPAVPMKIHGKIQFDVVLKGGNIEYVRGEDCITIPISETIQLLYEMYTAYVIIAGKGLLSMIIMSMIQTLKMTQLDPYYKIDDKEPSDDPHYTGITVSLL